ncbi:hypothetical protein ACET3Z_027762 [Daucus carota]
MATKGGASQQSGSKGNSRVSKLNRSRKREGFPLFDNEERLSQEQIEVKEVCKYWFLLDWSMIEAFKGGNLRLIPLARARIEFLSKAIKPELMGKGLEGDEDSLWEINEILQNEGWWCKADHLQVKEVLPSPKQAAIQNAALMGFLKAKEHLIHPNSRTQAFEGNPEGVRMALNQIHYGSIEESRKKAEKKMPKDELFSITMNFIRSWAHLVEASVLRDAFRGNCRAISLALGQIHHHSLEPKNVQDTPKGSTEGVGANPEKLESLGIEQTLSSHESTQSLINPLTPRGDPYIFPEDSPVAKVSLPTSPKESLCTKHASSLKDQFSNLPVNAVSSLEQADFQHETVHTSNWIPRINKQSLSTSESITTQELNTQVSSHDSLPTPLEDLQEGLLNGFSNMRVKSKRGRPRKIKHHPLNKSFKLPRKRKMRGEGLQQVSHFFLNNTYDEAEAIYETGLSIGLLPVNSREESLDLIRKNLAS